MSDGGINGKKKMRAKEYACRCCMYYQSRVMGQRYMVMHIGRKGRAVEFVELPAAWDGSRRKVGFRRVLGDCHSSEFKGKVTQGEKCIWGTLFLSPSHDCTTPK